MAPRRKVAYGSAVVSLSSFATCTGQHGPYIHLWVSVFDVSARRASDGVWYELTPGLAAHPLQLDLMAGVQAGTEADLGGAAALPAGGYDAIRLQLGVPSPGQPPTGLCGKRLPCVILQYGTAVPLVLSDPNGEVLIGADRILGGAWQVNAGQTARLTLFWDVCASIQPESNYWFRLTPVLQAGASAPSGGAITGRVVDTATGLPIEPGSVTVALEQPDPSGISRVLLLTHASPDGSFRFSSVPQSSAGPGSPQPALQLVIAAINRLNAAYAPVVVSGVEPGASLGDIPLSTPTTTNNAPAALFGEVRDAAASPSAPTTVVVSALLGVAAETATAVTIPLMQQGQATATISVAPNPMDCPAGDACARYTLAVPAQGAQAGDWNPGLQRIGWTQEPSSSSVYRIEIRRTGQPLPQCDVVGFVDVPATPGGLQQVPTFDLPPCP